MHDSPPTPDQPLDLDDPNGPASAVALRAQIDALREQADEHLAGWQRAQADYENLRKRTKSELEERGVEMAAQLMRPLLPVLDDFERALESVGGEDPDAWIEGVRLIQQKLSRYLEAVGVQAIIAEGQAFDPSLHEAVGARPGPSGHVLDEVQKGYRLGRRVLRPVRVLVGNGDEPVAPESEEATRP